MPPGRFRTAGPAGRKTLPPAPLPPRALCLFGGAYFGGNCWVAPGRDGSACRAAVFWAARLAAVVAGANWVLVGAGCGVTGLRALGRLLLGARRPRRG